MPAIRLRTFSAILTTATLVACGSTPRAASAESAPESTPAQPRQNQQPQGGAVTAAADRPRPAAAVATEAPASTSGAVPVGYYECYFTGTYGMQTSSMTSMRIRGPAEYQAMDERGRYSQSDGALRMETGPLAGRVAHVRESSGKPAIVFIRKENEVDGKPTLDISDTWCYFEPR